MRYINIQKIEIIHVLHDKPALPTKHSQPETRNRVLRLVLNRVPSFVPDIYINYKVHNTDEFLLCIVPKQSCFLGVLTRHIS